MRYKNRTEAGRLLAQAIISSVGVPDKALVLGLPRGGVPVAAEVAKALSAELDVLVVRKLGMPFDPEFAFGAISILDSIYLDRLLIERSGLSIQAQTEVIAKETTELNRRIGKYRANKGPIQAEGKTVFVVDDGIATGATVRAALMAVKKMNPAKVILAVPVAPLATKDDFLDLADQVICPLYPDSFSGVGQWYEHFTQVEDEEVLSLLEKAKQDSI